MNRSILALVVLASACGGGVPRPVQSVPMHEIRSSDASLTPSFPLARAALVEQGLWRSEQPVLRGLPAGRFAVSGDSTLAIIDTEGRVLRWFDAGESTFGSVRVDPSANALRTMAGTVNLAQLSFTPFSRGPMHTCDWDVPVCVRILEQGDEISLELVEPVREHSIARVPLTAAAFGIELDAVHGATNVGVTEGDAVASYFGNPDLVVSGDKVAFVAQFGDRTLLCACDVEQPSDGRCVEVDDSAEIVELAAARNQVSIRTRPPDDEVKAFDLESLQSIVLGTDDARWYRRYGRVEERCLASNCSISVATTGELLATVSADRIVTSPHGFAAWSDTRVRFFDRLARELGNSEIPFAPDAGDDSMTTELDSEELHVLSREHGLWRIPVGESAVRWTRLPIQRARTTNVEGARIAIGSDEVVLGVSAEGVVEVDRSSAITSQLDQVRRRRAAFVEVRDRLPRSALLAFGTGPVASDRYATIEDGRTVKVYGPDGRRIGHEVRLRTRIARSRCSELEFLTDVSLLLSGPAPCVPTVIDAIDGSTHTLDARHAVAAASESGDRALLLANGRLSVLDGRRGTTLAILRLDIEGPEEITLTADGRFAMVHGRTEAVLVDLSEVEHGSRATGAEVRNVAIARFRQEAFVGFDAINEVVVLLASEADELAVRAPRFSDSPSGSAPTTIRVPVQHPLGSVFGLGAAVPGYLALERLDGVSLVRLEDGTTLDLEVVATNLGVALLSRDGDSVDGAIEGAIPAVLLQTPTGVARLPSDRGRLATRIRDFFGGVPRPVAP